MPADPIKVLVVDDHPALRDGLLGLLRQVDGLEPAGALAGISGLHAAIADLAPDVVVLDYSLRRGDGLSACFEIKQRPRSPGVVLYSAYVDGVFAVPATLAQADAVVSKTAPVDELLSAVRAVADGERIMPLLLPDTITAASARLAPDDLPIIGMLLARESVDEIAGTLGVTSAEVRSRALRIMGRLQGDAVSPVGERAPVLG